ncbi:hypothetical protein NX773_08255 [Massilia solisilvae]|uniref:Cytochrome c domain-containing protein n=1 Tax=Massilia solisilvae TaxID=1811225 RepID=A0ABT2BI16_9BURK|nr:hypothetical protein [Massilia solisilvae]MCS0608155.1 hypothetical protein [Massilia solisilvae]
MFIRRFCLGLGGALFALAAHAAAVDPFADHNGIVPARADYNGALFLLSYHYPSGLPAPAMPWRSAIHARQISVQNARYYVAALKDTVAKDMHELLQDYDSWDPDRRGWYNDPWLGAQREAIHGLSVAVASVEPALFPRSRLSKPFTTYTVTYYNKTAAQTLGKIWGTSAMSPIVDQASTQYAEGSITVKLAFTTADPSVWPAMEGALVWPAMVTANATTGQFDEPTLHGLRLMQVDVVVKDTQSAPRTGWVFATFVYDRDAREGANGIWDKMVPLGAQWGLDPQVNSAIDPDAPLRESWINPRAPRYAMETLGWGGRLSGPNDHGKNDISFVDDGTRRLVRSAGNTACLSCHGTSQWNANKQGMPSFILPLAPPVGGRGSPYLNSPAPGSVEWLRWFQNRPGNVPMDEGSIAGDFDLALTFRVLPAWQQAMTGNAHALQSLDASGKKIERVGAETE